MDVLGGAGGHRADVHGRNEKAIAFVPPEGLEIKADDPDGEGQEHGRE